MASTSKTPDYYKMYSIYFLIFEFLTFYCESARILAVFPSPSISHQLVFRPFTQELAKRGHEVVVITTDPAFPKGNAPKNLHEIDLHDLSYSMFEPKHELLVSGKERDLKRQIQLINELVVNIIEKQLLSEQIQNLINDKSITFDIALIELVTRPALAYSHIFKVPVIQISSLGGNAEILEMVGASLHPNIYPLASRKNIYNLTLWQNFFELYKYFSIDYMITSDENNENEMLRRTIDANIPTIAELKKNVQMCFFNVHPLWDSNRPVPKNVIYINGMHLKPNKNLPEDLKSYLDESRNGAIYVSFGTNSRPSTFSPEKIQILMNVFSQLHYNVLLKWDKENIPSSPKNIKVQKWYPQSDLLKHPNIKAFVTQGGLQSTDEAIDAGVPLVGIPLLIDQWFNTEKYELYKIGFKLDLETLTEDIFRNAIETVIHNTSYRRNILKLRVIMRDESQTALQRAVWWTEHVLRHGGTHLRAPAANASWTEYYEIDLVVTALFFVLSSLIIITYLIRSVVSRILSSTLKLTGYKSE